MKEQFGQCVEVTAIPPGMSYVAVLVRLGQGLTEGGLHAQRGLGEADGLAVAPHVGVSADRVPHLGEGEVGHGDGAAAQDPEATLTVEGHQEVLAHEHGPPYVGQAAQVLQVAPHQDGPLALLPEGTVHGQHMDVHRGATGLVQRQSLLEQRARV